jgi:CRP-like cAMP-binding protein
MPCCFTDVLLTGCLHSLTLIGQVDLGRVPERGRLLPGSLFNEEAATSTNAVELKASIVALSPVTEVISFTSEQLSAVSTCPCRHDSGLMQEATHTCNT